MKNASILVVEDDEIVAGFLSTALSGHGYQVSVAGDGEAAWEILQRWQRSSADDGLPPLPSAIVLDRQMPRLDGMGLLHRLKAAPALRPIPVVMETASGDQNSINEGIAAGAYHYLVKPLERALLLTVVDNVVQQFQDMQALQLTVQQADSALACLDQGHFHFRDLDQARQLANTLARTCPDPQRVVVGLLELMVNAVEHGNLGITYSEKSQLLLEERWLAEVRSRLAKSEYRTKSVEVHFERLAGTINITLRDQGQGFAWRQFLDFDPQRAFDPHGRGIALSRLMSFDKLEYLGNGNTVRITVNTH